MKFKILSLFLLFFSTLNSHYNDPLALPLISYTDLHDCHIRQQMELIWEHKRQFIKKNGHLVNQDPVAYYRKLFAMSDSLKSSTRSQFCQKRTEVIDQFVHSIDTLRTYLILKS